jgi:hypothetical protein
MIERSLLLALALATGFGFVWVWERRPAFAGRTIEAGLTLVIGPNCVLCPQARAALERAGLAHRLIDVSQSEGLGIRSLPTLLSVATDGAVEWRRSGRSAVMEAVRLAEGVA